MSKPKIAIIVGSTRPQRFADTAVAWFANIASKYDEAAFEVVDLRDYPLPFFDETAPVAAKPPGHEVAKKWEAKLAEFDGFVFSVAEYNHGMTAVLKNALDYAYQAWSRKPVAFLGYGGVGGARAVEQVRMVTSQLQMAPLSGGVAITMPEMMAVGKGEKQLSDYDYLNDAAKATLDDLLWWTKALKSAREAS